MFTSHDGDIKLRAYTISASDQDRVLMIRKPRIKKATEQTDFTQNTGCACGLDEGLDVINEGFSGLDVNTG
jgi:hypothetical protein